MKLIISDFDHTITSKDSFWEFIKFNSDPISFFKIFLLIPGVVRFKLGVWNAKQLKQKFLKIFFDGYDGDSLRQQGALFATTQIPKMINPEIFNRILQLQADDNPVVIVSASLDIWLLPWCEQYQFDCICTRTGIDGAHFNNEIIGPNLKGKAKVEAIQAQFDLSQYDEIIVFGNRNLDDEMLRLATNDKYRYRI